MSLREITDEQFRESTTIDGNRLDMALDDMEKSINSIPHRNVGRRFTQSQIVAGYPPAPDPAAVIYRLPFMRSSNTAADVVAGGTAPAYANVQRVKGIALRSAGLPVQWIWTIPFAINEPALLVDLCVWLQTDTSWFVYGNDFVGAAGNWVENIGVVVSIDDPFVPEQRERNRQALVRVNTRCDVQRTNPLGGVLINNFRPLLTGGGLSGLCIRSDDIEIPLPRNSRFRVFISLPQTGEVPWGDTPMLSRQVPTVTATILEEVGRHG